MAKRVREFDDDYGYLLGDDNGAEGSSPVKANDNESDDIDPLDAFMLMNQKQVSLDAVTVTVAPDIVSNAEDYAEDKDQIYVRDGSDDDDPDAPEYDSDGIPVINQTKKKIEPLPPTDHRTINYAPFNKAFYKECKEITDISEDEVAKHRKENEISYTSSNNAAVPRPILQFSQAGFDLKLLQEIQKVGYERPTPIQSQGIPIALAGHDMIGLARTGSGKTLAYVWPMLMHVLDQPQMVVGDGPIGLVLAPTRELVVQIYNETKKFSKLFNMRVAAIYGGPMKYEMTKVLKEQVPEIVVATPGRLIDLIQMKATNLRRCTMVVLDEADKMFEMGFEYQIRSIVNNIRSDRQTLLFSATMKRHIENFARDILHTPVRLTIGAVGHANKDVTQVVSVVQDSLDKWMWLSSRLDEFVADGKVLIFVLTKVDVDSLALRLQEYFRSRQLDIGVESIHGDKEQVERNAAIKKFGSNSSNTHVLVATDIAARGLDIKNINTVINYSVAHSSDTYIHRIGRTSRMNVNGVKPGIAYTLLTPSDTSFAVELYHILLASSQQVPDELIAIAKRDKKFYQHRSEHHKHAGLGVHNRPAMTSAMAAESTNYAPTHLPKPSSHSDVATYSTSSSYSVIKGFVRASSSADTDESKKKGRWDH